MISGPSLTTNGPRRSWCDRVDIWCPRLAIVLTAIVLGAAPASSQPAPPTASPAQGDLVPAPAPAAVDPDRALMFDATRDLFTAVSANDLEGVQGAISAGADLEARNIWGMTPIDVAVDRSYYDIAHYLLSIRNQGASDARSPTGPGGARSQASPLSVLIPGGSDAARAAAAKASREERARARSSRRDEYAWPRNRPNPFNPSEPAPGAILPIERVVEVP